MKLVSTNGLVTAPFERATHYGPGSSRASARASNHAPQSRDRLIGKHQSMLEVYRQIEAFGPRRFPVLILGETGTGKELVAQAIHEASRVSAGPFEALNCGAIPEELAESELFGHVRGAFTGACSPFSGALRRANGGTLFLDEIFEMPPRLQPKLLRALEESRVRPLGSEKYIPTNFRLIAATHQDLGAQAQRGNFRLDLYYRLAVGTILLPPLRERSSDVPALVDHFLKTEESDLDRHAKLEEGLTSWLQDQPWPGNVRGLRHAVMRALALKKGPALSRRDFEERQQAQQPLGDDALILSGKSFRELKQEIYCWAMAKNKSKSAAARALGIAKSTFNDQLRDLGLS